MSDTGFVPPSRKPGRLRRGAGFLLAPHHYVPVEDIRQGRRLIGDLMAVIGERRGRTRTIRLDAAGSFDIPAMVFDAGITVTEVERRLVNRRVQTRRNTLIDLALGCLLFTAWVWDGGATRFGGMSLIDVALFLAVTACFFVAAFYNALINWQVRARQLGSIAAFLLGPVERSRRLKAAESNRKGGFFFRSAFFHAIARS